MRPSRAAPVPRLLLSIALAGTACAGAAADVASAAVTASPTPEEARRANDLAQAAYYEKQARARADDSDRTPWWGPLVLGAVLTLGGSAATLVLTNRAADRKAHDEQERLYRRQKLQVGLAVRALIEALARFRLDGAGPVAAFLSRDHLVAQPAQPATFDRQSAYYLKYDLVSTVYRLCALLGWIELYRIDPEFLSGRPDERAAFEAAFSRIRTILGDDVEALGSRAFEGMPPDAAASGDGVILADDQRAIGEKMLTALTEKVTRGVVGYAQFAEQLFRFPGRYGPEQGPGEGEHRERSQDHWVWNATSFIVGIGDTAGPDRRVARLRALLAVLQALLPRLLPVELRNGLGKDGP